MKRKAINILPGERLAIILPNGIDRILLDCHPDSGCVHIDMENLISLRSAIQQNLVSVRGYTVKTTA